VQDLCARPPQTIQGLDVLRSIAITLVFSTHFPFNFSSFPRLKSFPLIYWGWSGVDLFFVLSGYLIGIQLWKEISTTGTIQVGRFLLRRGLRIWPLYFFVISLIVVKAALLNRTNVTLADITFLSNYFPYSVGGGWSLSTEEQFYVIVPLALISLKFLGPKILVLMPAISLVVLPFSRMLALRHHSLNWSDARFSLYKPIHTHADGLAIGLLIAWVAVFRPNAISSRTIRTTVAAVSLLLAIGL
jgi:peptidoglycan/LPS O-acetylase OafA/YrhL